MEGDISGCFDNIDHEILLSILAEKIHDQRFLRLIRNLLKAGYMEEWRYHATLSGSPQGGVCSPILANIYLDKLDQFVEQTLLPTYNRGKKRRKNPQYEALREQAVKMRKQGKKKEAKALLKQVQHMPSRDPEDPNYRRLKFCRYADDFLLGLSGPKEEAEEIKRQLAEFLRQTLKLELSPDKTLITHARTQTARFLGYEVVNQQNDEKRHKNGRRSTNGTIGVRLPTGVLEKKSATYMRNVFPTHRPELLNESDFTIIERFQSEYRGLIQYYLLAVNVSWLWRLHWIMKGSLLKTLATKHKSTVRKMKRKYRASVITPYGKMECLEMQVEREGKKPLVARFGGIPLRRQKRVILIDHAPGMVKTERNELLKRLLADKCELCGNTDNCEVQHVRKLADLKQPGRREKPEWMQVMAARRRKTLVVCQKCHDAIHAGKLVSSTQKVTGEPCELKGSSTVRRGTDAKVPST